MKYIYTSSLSPLFFLSLFGFLIILSLPVSNSLIETICQTFSSLPSTNAAYLEQTKRKSESLFKYLIRFGLTSWFSERRTIQRSLRRHTVRAKLKWVAHKPPDCINKQIIILEIIKNIYVYIKKNKRILV